MPTRVRRRPWLAALLLLAVAAAVLTRMWLEPVRIATGSMTPTLRPGDRVLVVHPLTTTAWRSGDVVLLTSPEEELMVKRVVATAGESVALRDGRLVVDGSRRAEAYADPADLDGVYFGPVTVPDGQVFVMGDRRPGSKDSRVFGAVDASAVDGRVVAVLWPLDRAGAVR